MPEARYSLSDVLGRGGDALIEQSVKRDPVLKKQEIETQMGRPANEIARDLRNALISSGMPEAQAKSLVATVRARGYRLGLDPAEVVIEP